MPYKDPEKRKKFAREYTKKWRRKHPIEAREVANRYRHNHPEKTREWSRNDYHRHIEKRRERNRRSGYEYRLKLKQKVIDKLGGRCINHLKNFGCECTDIKILQIDHVKGGGNKERNEIISLATFYRKVLNDNSGMYQILCSNCNILKRLQNHEIHEYRKPNSLS